MSNRPIIIIGSQKTLCGALRQAVARIFENVSVVTDMAEIADPSQYLVLAFVDEDNLQDISDLSGRTPVIALAQQGVMLESALFEKEFKSPFRFGAVVDYVGETFRQQERYKLLSPVSFGSQITLNPREYSLSHQAFDKAVRLTEKETDILLFLSKNLNQSVQRQNLLDGVWGYADNVETHTLETHIYRLRQKLKNQLSLDDFLVTKDDGYILNF